MIIYGNEHRPASTIASNDPMIDNGPLLSGRVDQIYYVKYFRHESEAKMRGLGRTVCRLVAYCDNRVASLKSSCVISLSILSHE